MTIAQRRIRPVLGIVLAAALAAGQAVAAETSTSTGTGPASAADSLQQAFMDVARRVGPAVVSIAVEHTERVPLRQFGFGGGPEDEFFNRFFEDFFGQMPEREFKSRGVGSGVIINDEGYILTNEHVVAGADKLTVTLPDGREFPAQVTGTDPTSDLAVVKIEAKHLPVAELGDSDTVQIGQWAVAIGNPFGFAVGSSEPTVTVGVISALDRAIHAGQERQYTNLLQTDAAINPGNSGGPLVDLSGKVIGINVAIFSTSGGYQGIGFAVPSNTARAIVGDLIKGQKILYGWLGVNVQNMDRQLAEFFGIPDQQGIVVARVVPGGPAEKAGLKDGDVIFRYQDQPIRSVRDLLGVVARTKVGTKVPLEMIREKKPLTVTVEVSERPAGPPGLTAGAAAWRGLEVSELTEELAQRFRVEDRRGVVVTRVAPDSPAADADLRAGDVINQINRTPISTLADYAKAIESLQGDGLVRTHRGYAIVKAAKE